jgi:hypothetical protein
MCNLFLTIEVFKEYSHPKGRDHQKELRVTFNRDNSIPKSRKDKVKDTFSISKLDFRGAREFNFRLGYLRLCCRLPNGRALGAHQGEQNSPNGELQSLH